MKNVELKELEVQEDFKEAFLPYNELAKFHGQAA